MTRPASRAAAGTVAQINDYQNRIWLTALPLMWGRTPVRSHANFMRYPLFLDLTNQPVTVIGAGKVAARKIKILLKAGANVTVVSPKTDRLPATVHWIRRT